ncbi:MAG: hypothetical protein IPK54_13325 [Dokdonella sp.]|uniref:hypothetical protein n=1 Tax=Dokdonella sp. TaxID=2291710 RepID=UPI0025C1C18E|nr:hypothetical protein [Dokdonella sp.]MBK8124514.1 hypothetical protein [Dokdonella sp.]
MPSLSSSAACTRASTKRAPEAVCSAHNAVKPINANTTNKPMPTRRRMRRWRIGFTLLGFLSRGVFTGRAR